MKVTIRIEEFRVLDINEAKETFDVRFWLQMEWFDSRLTFVNLKPYVEDILPRQDAKKIWMPILTLEYTNRHIDTSVEEATIKVHTTFSLSIFKSSI